MIDVEGKQKELEGLRRSGERVFKPGYEKGVFGEAAEGGE